MKRYFWLVYLLLVTVAATLAAAIVNAYISTQLAAPLKLAQTQASNTSSPLVQKAPLPHYEVINKRNIFNAAPPSDTPEPPRLIAPPPPSPEVSATPLPLKLVGIMAGTRPQAPRFAIIESTGSPPGQAVYQVGDSVQQIFIVDILPGCVVFDRGGASKSSASKRMRVRHLPLRPRHVRLLHHTSATASEAASEISCALTQGPGRSSVRSSWRISPMWAPCQDRQPSRRTLPRGNSSGFACRGCAPEGYYSK